MPNEKGSSETNVDSKFQPKSFQEKPDPVKTSYIDSLFFDSLPEPSDRKPQLTNKAHEQGLQPVDLGVKEERSGFIDQAYFGTAEDVGSDSTQDESKETGAEFITKLREQLSINQYHGRTLDFKSTRKTLTRSRQDSFGFRIPDDDAIKFHNLTEHEAANVLWRCAVSVQENLLVFNKPPGLPSQDGSGVRFSVTSLLPLVARQLRSGNHDALEDLKLVHRLDKEATGALIVSRNKESHLKLTEAFANRWIKKSYLCITSGIPELAEGFIDFPITEQWIKGHYRMVARRPVRQDLDAEPEKPLPNAASNALTYYTMLDRRNDTALLECEAVTGLKHQIRTHLATGLGTPVLGDHKYSHFSFLAPQRLSKRTLDALEIRQSKVRYLGLHLHAHRLQFGGADKANRTRQFLPPPPGFFNFIDRSSFKEGRSINVPIPKFFLDNAQRLKLRLPRMLRWTRGKIF